MTDQQSPTAARCELLIGCYTDEQGADGVHVCSATSDSYEERGPSLTLRNPTWLVPFQDVVLAACERPQSTLAVLRREGDGLRVVAEQPTGGADACHLAVSPDQAWVAVANYTSGQVTLFAAPVDGELAPASDLYTLQGSGPVPDRQEMAHAHQITWLDDTHFLVSDLGSDKLRVMRVADAKLVELEPVTLPSGMGPRHCVTRTSNTGELHLAIGGELSGEVVSLRHEGTEWDQGWWILDRIPGTEQVGRSQPSGLRFFGDDLVLANRAINSVSLIRWSDEGRLTLLTEAPCGGDHPRDIVVHDSYVWIANQKGNNVTVLSCAADEFSTVTSVPVQQPASLLFDAR